MQTNFFRQIAKLNLKVDVQMILQESTDNSFVLSVLLNNEQCGDEARITRNCSDTVTNRFETNGG